MAKRVMLIHREMWEAKVLEAARGRLGRVAMSVICRYWGDDSNRMRALIGLVWPDYAALRLPCLISGGKIDEEGHVTADMIDRGEEVIRNFELYPSLLALESAFRRLADQIRLSDADRRDLFAALQYWIVQDRRQRPEEVEAKPRINGAAYG